MLSKFKAIAQQFIECHFKLWGVQLETNLPPEFIITKHAHERMVERLGCKPDKVYKLCVKAWLSKKVRRPLTNRLIYAKSFDERHYTHYYREFMGYIFVFGINGRVRWALQEQKVLITVFK